MNPVEGVKTFNVGVFGIGWVAGEHIKAFLRNPHMKVAALASHRKESAQAVREKLNLDCDVLYTYDELVQLCWKARKRPPTSTSRTNRTRSARR